MTELNLTVRQLADRIGGRVVGDDSGVISGIAPLSLACAGDVSFLSDDQHSAELAETNACAVIVGTDRPAAQTPLICVD
ncbi:MAG: UDP-3-O-(3-hydroxymyristoyl)glucosamine N-acyltransferase, partial [Phycisphaerae bacterium]|nr:UDP-3-O-(3-hydroxymyristoyl)glucosamine N-acyltransferase [Phycisphaerae bacterium]